MRQLILGVLLLAATCAAPRPAWCGRHIGPMPPGTVSAHRYARTYYYARPFNYRNLYDYPWHPPQYRRELPLVEIPRYELPEQLPPPPPAEVPPRLPAEE